MRVLALAAVLLLPAAARGQVVTEMTPERVREAIAYGTSQRESPAYVIRKPGGFGSAYKPVLGTFTTPFARVALAAFDAKRQYRTFTEADVAPEMLAPELHVYAGAQARYARVSNVQTVVITPKNQREPAATIRPTSVRDIPVEYRNAMGMTADGRSLFAVFPLDALRESNEVHIVYDGRVHDGGEHKYCDDCAVPFKLDKVR